MGKVSQITSSEKILTGGMALSAVCKRWRESEVCLPEKDAGVEDGDVELEAVIEMREKRR
jgi:hypothetical protein